MATMTFVAFLNARCVIQTAIQKMFPGELSIRQLLTLIVPSLISVLFLTLLFSKGMSATKIVAEYSTAGYYRHCDFFSTIVATMLLNLFFATPPVLTFLTGFSVIFWWAIPCTRVMKKYGFWNTCDK
jgi:hypothetical protein